MRYQAGKHLNILTRARLVTVSSATGEFPAANAYDKDSTRPVLAAVGVSDWNLNADLAFDDYGDFEGTFVGGIPPGWTNRWVNAGTTGQENALFVAPGAHALKLITTANADVAEISIDYPCAPGEQLRINAQMRTDGLSGTPTVACRVYDLRTRKWFNGTAWVTSAADAFTETASTYQTKGLTLTLDRDQGDATTIRVSLRSTATAGAATRTTYVDKFEVHPTWDAGAFIGHNVDSGSAVTLQGSHDNAAWTTAATSTNRRPSLYALATARQIYRYVMLQAAGVNSEQLAIGEVLILQLASPGWSWSNGLPTKWQPKETRHQTSAGRTHVLALSADIPRRITIDLDLVSDTLRTAFRDDLALRTRLGQELAFVIPDVLVADCYFGRIVDGLELNRRPCSDYETGGITIEEDGFPTIGLGV